MIEPHVLILLSAADSREEQKQMFWGENINLQFKEMPEVHATSIQTFQPFKITVFN